ncbi:MAG: pilin [bacterium]|nr:pilin [bacterium]
MKQEYISFLLIILVTTVMLTGNLWALPSQGDLPVGPSGEPSGSGVPSLGPTISSGGITSGGTGDVAGEVDTVEDVFAIFDRLVDWIFTLLLIFATGAILIAAFSYLTASGDPEKVEKSHKMILYAVIALAVGFGTRGIIALTSLLVTGSPDLPSLP